MGLTLKDTAVVLLATLSIAMVENVTCNEVSSPKINPISISAKETVTPSDVSYPTINPINIYSYETITCNDNPTKILNAANLNISTYETVTPSDVPTVAIQATSNISVSAFETLTPSDSPTPRLAPISIYGYETITPSDSPKESIAPINISNQENVTVSDVGTVVTGAPPAPDINIYQAPGAELVTNGGMENGDPPTGWVALRTPASFEQSSYYAHGGNYSAHILDSTPSYSGFISSQSITIIPGAAYQISFWYYILSGTLRFEADNFTLTRTYTTTGSGQQATIVATLANAVQQIDFINDSNSVSAEFFIDDVSITQLGYPVETSTISDNPTVKLNSLAISGQENVSIADSSTLKVNAANITISNAENVTASDNPAELLKPLVISSQDNVSISDSQNLLLNKLVIQSAENVTISDAKTVYVGAAGLISIAVVENIGISDASTPQVNAWFNVMQPSTVWTNVPGAGATVWTNVTPPGATVWHNLSAGPGTSWTNVGGIVTVWKKVT